MIPTEFVVGTMEVVCISSLNSLCLPGKSVCTIVTLAKWEWFYQYKDERVMKRGVDYEARKSAIGRRIWEQVLTIYPQLEDKAST